jgi:hypothetical protein
LRMQDAGAGPMSTFANLLGIEFVVIIFSTLVSNILRILYSLIKNENTLCKFFLTSF